MANPIPLMRAGQFLHIASSLQQRGLSAERTLGRTNLQMWLDCDADDLILQRHTYLFMDLATRETGCKAFGRLVGEDNSLESLGSFGRLVCRGVTTYHLLSNLCRLMPMHGTALSYWLISTGNEVWICRGRFAGVEAGVRQMEQYILMLLLDAIRLGAGRTWRPAKICVQSPSLPGLRESDDFADTQLRFGHWCTAIAVPQAALWRPIVRHWEAPSESPDAALEKLRATQPGDDLTTSLRQLVRAFLAEGYPGVSAVAEAIGMPVRTLQRRLGKELVSYSEVVEQARFMRAVELLRDADVKIVDIAYDLGYADPAIFSRAFRRWAGMTPRDYRRHSAGADFARA